MYEKMTTVQTTDSASTDVLATAQQKKREVPFAKFEYISDAGLKQLLTSPHISNEHKKELRGLKRLRVGPNCYRVEYDYGKRAEGRGRLMGMGLQQVHARTAPLRQYLCGRQYHDIDQANSTPTLYLHLLKENNLVCPELDNYIRNRQECLERWGLTKQGFLSLLNIEKISSTAPEVHAIHNVLYQKLMPILRPQYPDIANRVKNSKDPKVLANRGGCFMSRVAYTVEGETLLAMHDFLEKEGWLPEVLVFDGLQVRRQSPEGAFPKDVLRQCEKYVAEHTGVAIRLAEKPMDVPTSFLTEHKLTIPDKWVPPGNEPEVTTVQPPAEVEGELDFASLREIEKYKNFDFRRVYAPSHKNAMEWFRELRGTSIMKHSSGTLFILGDDNRWRMEDNVAESDLNLQIAETLVKGFRELLSDVEDHDQQRNLEELKRMFARFQSLAEGSEWSSAVARNVYRKQKKDDSCIGRFLSHPELFAFDDGVYELFSGKFRPFQPDDYVLFTCGYDFPGHSERNQKIRDHIKRFYESIFKTKGEMEYRLFLVSRCCYGRMVDEIYIIQRGPGRNGKGTEATLISRTFGNYHQRIESKNFTGYRGNVDAPNSQLFKCLGKRYISTSETKVGEKFSSDLLKIMSARDPFTVRDLRGKCITFPFTGPLHIESNADLMYDETDLPLLLRSRALEYPYQFILSPGSNNGGDSNGDVNAGEGDSMLREMDVTLKDCFLSDEYRDEFIMMLLEHFREVVAPNNLLIGVPDEVTRFTQKNAMTNMDASVSGWLDSRYILTGSSKDMVKRADVWKLYDFDMNELIAKRPDGGMKKMEKSKFFGVLKTFLTLRSGLGGHWVYEGVMLRKPEAKEDVQEGETVADR